MKELSIKEKARRYGEALGRAKSYYSITTPVADIKLIEFIFPELKESIDERVKKVIKQVLSESTTEKDECYLDNGVTQQEVFAWLEKQGKNKMGISEATKQKLEDNLNKALEKETPESWNEFLEKQGEQKPAENKGMNLAEEDMTPFQKKVFCIIDTTIEEEQGLKQVCDELLRLAHDEIKQKPAWSEEDKNFMYDTLSNLTELKDRYGEGYGNVGKCIKWLKSIKDRMQPQNTWKPSEEQMDALRYYIDNIIIKDGDFDRRIIDLYHDLLKL